MLDVWLLYNVMYASSVYSMAYVITAATVYGVYGALTGPWIFVETSNYDLEMHLNEI